MTKDTERFAFGSNWIKFIDTYLDEEAVVSAEKDFCDLLKLTSLEGLSFIDIGSGSGLSSLVAYRLNASKIVSFDFDIESVQATKRLRESVGAPSNWQVLHGSVLDGDFMNDLGKFDVVYSWGVLHHTGDMWQAFKNIAVVMKPNGYFYVAIYNKDEGPKGSLYWLKRKRFYNKHGHIVKSAMFLEFVLRTQFIPKLIRLQNPFKTKKKRRGMGYYTDVIDWIGGYPYEFASPEEITSFCEQNLGMTLVNSRLKGGLSNNEFVFRQTV